MVCNEHLGRLVWISKTSGAPAEVGIVNEIRSSTVTDLCSFQRSKSGLHDNTVGKKDETFFESDQAELQHFAQELSVWIEMMCEELEISRLHVFAPLNFNNILRRSRSSKLSLRVVEHDANLAHLSAEELRVYWIIAGHT